AAGLYLAPRGVRPLARGGSYVAGAEDVNALSYNPAGLADASDSVLLDMALPLHGSTYTRSVYGDGVYEPAVRGTGLGLPSPTLGAVLDLGLSPRLRFGFALAADYPLMQNWPEVRQDPVTPQRYAVGSYRGTAISKVSTGVGYRVNDVVSVGGALQLLVGNFASQTTLSACDGALCTQPENPDYDATIQMRASGLVVPGANLGVQMRATPWLRFGFSWETGYRIDSPATFRVRLPSAPAYADAEMDPTEPRGRVVMHLPQTFRAGVEVQPVAHARLELAGTYEPWAVHDQISVGIESGTMKHLFALGSYGLQPMSLQRGFRNTFSARLGGEYAPTLGDDRPLHVRAGLMYEPSAVPNVMMTPMTVDLDKVLAAVGLQVSWERLHLEATVAHVFMVDRTVTAGRVMQMNATRPAFAGRTPVGNGTYQSSANLVGVGARIDI
ncbi:MAG TPA: outer membrane protein transport protein, partial [Myxococcota bacterium]|nr:outer membrane protein transport protein [Myxococcota bacterium]